MICGHVDLGMKGDVGFYDGSVVVPLERVSHLVEVMFEFVHERSILRRSGPFHCQRLDSEAETVDLVNVATRDWRNEGTAAAVPVHQPVGFEQSERLSDGSAADGEAFGEFRLKDPAPRSQLSSQDHVPQRFVYELESFFVFRWRSHTHMLAVNTGQEGGP